MAQVQSLAGNLRSHKPKTQQKKRKEKLRTLSNECYYRLRHLQALSGLWPVLTASALALLGPHLQHGLLPPTWISQRQGRPRGPRLPAEEWTKTQRKRDDDKGRREGERGSPCEASCRHIPLNQQPSPAPLLLGGHPLLPGPHTQRPLRDHGGKSEGPRGSSLPISSPADTPPFNTSHPQELPTSTGLHFPI